MEISLDWLVGSHLNHIRDHDGHPDRDRRRRAASRFRLRPTRLAATKDLHHLLGHQRAIEFFAPVRKPEGDGKRNASIAHAMLAYAAGAHSRLANNWNFARSSGRSHASSSFSEASCNQAEPERQSSPHRATCAFPTWSDSQKSPLPRPRATVATAPIRKRCARRGPDCWESVGPRFGDSLPAARSLPFVQRQASLSSIGLRWKPGSTRKRKGAEHDTFMVRAYGSALYTCCVCGQARARVALRMDNGRLQCLPRGPQMRACEP